MKISEKIKSFFEEKGLSHTQIGAKYGVSQQTITNYFNEKRAIPLDFLVWMKEEFPEIDINSIISKKENYIVSESRAMYKRKETREEILNDIGKILDKYV
ncbi:helix-turn-helix domain-containing protein [Chryseobacterium sp. Hurlbut01]|uniref:helix-turn-helix domain-containing protein n=1 Tax=Chryseobacterium sp. Hurlbut01 TaxID=1681828 RepID=UPI00067D59B5|nr:helix-turn-helix transcriptional regulator [Chryseobacterium sp. Hurlbut01]KNB61009.1 hypothetical protein AC804_17875 [Chryseobacterium sp. Hurlbut01]